jgi:hypothetical protein
MMKTSNSTTDNETQWLMLGSERFLRVTQSVVIALVATNVG